MAVLGLTVNCGPTRALGAAAVMKHSCVQGVFSEESAACLSQGSEVTIEVPWARLLKCNSAELQCSSSRALYHTLNRVEALGVIILPPF